MQFWPYFSPFQPLAKFWVMVEGLLFWSGQKSLREHFYDVYFERTLILDLRWCLRRGATQKGPGAPPLLPHLVLCMLESTEYPCKNRDPALSLLATQVE